MFHAIPDDLVTTWKQYREFVLHHERLKQPTAQAKDQPSAEPVARIPSDTDPDAPVPQHSSESGDTVVESAGPKVRDFVSDQASDPSAAASGSNANGATSAQDAKKKPARGPEPFDQSEREEMERMLEELRGHLGEISYSLPSVTSCRADYGGLCVVIYPSRFLEGEDIANNFLWNADR